MDPKDSLSDVGSEPEPITYSCNALTSFIGALETPLHIPTSRVVTQLWMVFFHERHSSVTDPGFHAHRRHSAQKEKYKPSPPSKTP